MNHLPATTPAISVVVLNYDGQQWMERCLSSLEAQTFFQRIEVIVTDNNSTDGSDQLAAEWFDRTGRGRVVQNGANLGYCQANNNGAAVATGQYLLFLNNDTWLEPDCLERLYGEAKTTDADIVAPLVLNYDDDSFQGIGAPGLDLFGMTTSLRPIEKDQQIFSGYGCALFVRAETFRHVGGFDGELFIYADETDLSWKVWIAGGEARTALSARLHHRGAPTVNPEGKTKVVESRTTETKRFLTNRNSLILLLKNCQHILLLLLIPHLLLLAAEAVVSFLLVRRWSYVRKCYIGAVADCWRLRRHVKEWRQRIRGFRRRGDFWMLRFLCLVPNRWGEVGRLIKLGPPKVDPR